PICAGRPRDSRRNETDDQSYDPKPGRAELQRDSAGDESGSRGHGAVPSAGGGSDGFLSDEDVGDPYFRSGDDAGGLGEGPQGTGTARRHPADAPTVEARTPGISHRRRGNYRNAGDGSERKTAAADRAAQGSCWRGFDRRTGDDRAFERVGRR